MDITSYPADMATAGHWEIVSGFGRDEFDSALYGACRGDSMPLVRHVIGLGASGYEFGLLGGCCGTNFEACELMFSLIRKTPKNIGEYFHAAAAFSGMNMVKWLLNHYPDVENCYEYILSGGARGGDMEAVSFVISNGEPTNWDDAAFNAAEGGDRGMTLLMLTKGANINTSLIGACYGDNISLVRWLLNRGATAVDNALWIAATSRYFDIVGMIFDMRPMEANDAVSRLFGRAFHENDFKMSDFLLSRAQTPLELQCKCGKTTADHIAEIISVLPKDSFSATLMSAQTARR
jgi:hypothetical protein